MLVRKQKKMELIVKCESAEDEIKEELSKSMCLFEKETSVYSNVLPKLSEIMGKHNFYRLFQYRLDPSTKFYNL